MPARYRFRPLTRADLPLLTRWLASPHVAEWWDESDGIAEIEQAMLDPATEPFLVLLDDVPIAYQHCYAPHDEPGHPYQDQPPGTRGIDQFIGDAGMLGQGHGSAFIRAFVDGLFARGAPRVVTDPDPRNARAIRAYEKAGFRPIDRRMTIFGDVYLMARDADDAASG